MTIAPFSVAPREQSRQPLRAWAAESEPASGRGRAERTRATNERRATDTRDSHDRASKAAHCALVCAHENRAQVRVGRSVGACPDRLWRTDPDDGHESGAVSADRSERGARHHRHRSRRRGGTGPSDPCGSWSGTDIVKALSSKKHKPATAVPEEESYFTCSWGLPQTLREELGMSGEGSGGDVAIEIEPYGAQTYGTGTIEWDVPTADDLVPNFLAAHEGSKALPGSPPAAFDGISGVAVATAGDTWTCLTLFQCPADECGDAAIKAARTLIKD